MTSLAVMGLLSEEAQVSEGSIRLNGQELLGMSREERRKIQGKNMSMIFQEPMTSLNPVMKIGAQVGESLKLHTDLDKETIRKRVIETLASVGLRNPETLIDQYPHEISGGLRQRVMIAMAIINHPDLIIADEPTTALDVTVQAQILNLLKKIHKDTGSSILFISHDLNVIKEVCQKVVVMYKGVIVERGDAKEVLKHPKHEYTRKLVASMPDQVRKVQNTKKLLEVKDLNVYYKENKKLFSSKDKRKHIIHNMSFDLYEGEILGVVGESGCGDRIEYHRRSQVLPRPSRTERERTCDIGVNLRAARCPRRAVPARRRNGCNRFGSGDGGGFRGSLSRYRPTLRHRRPSRDRTDGVAVRVGEDRHDARLRARLPYRHDARRNADPARSRLGVCG